MFSVDIGKNHNKNSEGFVRSDFDGKPPNFGSWDSLIPRTYLSTYTISTSIETSFKQCNPFKQPYRHNNQHIFHGNQAFQALNVAERVQKEMIQFNFA